MQEKLTGHGEAYQVAERLEALLGKDYLVTITDTQKGNVYRIKGGRKETPLKNALSRKKKVGEVRWLDKKNSLTVLDKAIYPVMKQFGEEFGYETLVRNWPGAAEEIHRQAPVIRKPMTESVKIGTRYETINSQEGADGRNS